MQDVEEFWEELYLSRAGGANIWSGKVNAPLASAVEGLPPGRALDLGCGEGGDSVHLARLGWQVTAVDVSPTALARASELAASAGVSPLVTTERHDLASSFPSGRFDLVVAMFFQSPLELPREQVLRRAAESLDAGGRLVLVEHGSAPAWSDHHDMVFPTPDELVAALDLDPSRFTPETVESRSREATSPDGHTGTLVDTVVVVRRDR
jgi:SAM-dependent methyltransferase